jgi:1,4-alpha-glucan branching enzyme
MAKREKSSDRPGKSIFVCRAPEAKAVFLAGTFNEWNQEATPMERVSAEEWRAEMALPPGQFEYKFVVDGVWCCEPGSEDNSQLPHCVPNSFGTMNRVIEVRNETEHAEVGAGGAA